MWRAPNVYTTDENIYIILRIPIWGNVVIIKLRE